MHTTQQSKSDFRANLKQVTIVCCIVLSVRLALGIEYTHSDLCQGGFIRYYVCYK